MTSPTVDVKLQMPVTSREVLSRPRLLRQLPAPTRGSVVVMTAPAGYGKTTLWNDWVTQYPDQHLGWFSLDEGDEDPVRLWAHLAALVDQLLGTEELAPAVRSDVATEPVLRETVVSRLAAAPSATTIVFDDVHRLKPGPGLAALQYFVEKLPQVIGLGIVGRSDPGVLESGRASDRVVHLDMQALAFTESEISSFMRRRGHELSDTQGRALHERTSGWPAAIELAAQELQYRSIRDLLGGLARETAIEQYIRSTVIAPLSEDLRDFVLRTSILRDLNADLCDYLLGRSDSAARLEELLRSGSFLATVHGGWIRYHQLFRDVLAVERSCTGMDETALHRRASEWFQHHGDPDAAVSHMVAARAYREAGRLMARYVVRYEREGRTETLRSWFRALPDEYQLMPSTAIGLAWSLATCGRPKASLDWVRHFEARCEPKPQYQVEIHLVRSFNLRMLGYYGEASREAQQVLHLLGEAETESPVRVTSRAVAFVQQLDIACWRGQMQQARELADDVLEWVPQAGHKLAHVRVLCLDGVLALELGDITRAQRRAEHGLYIAQDHGLDQSHAVAECHAVLAATARERGAHTTARDLDLAIDLVVRSPFASNRARVLLMMADVLAAEGRFKRAEHLATEAAKSSAATPDDHLELRVATASLGLALRQGNRPETRAWLSHVERLPISTVTSTVMQVRALVALERWDDARALLDTLPDTSLDARTLVAAKLLNARQRAATGAHEDADALATEAASHAERAGLWASLLDDIGGLNRGLPACVPPDVADAPSPRFLRRVIATQALPHAYMLSDPLKRLLTERELVVAEQLETRRSVAEISEQLYLSVNTVKSHLKSIYRKLDVCSRREAVDSIKHLQRAV